MDLFAFSQESERPISTHSTTGVTIIANFNKCCYYEKNKQRKEACCKCACELLQNPFPTLPPLFCTISLSTFVKPVIILLQESWIRLVFQIDLHGTVMLLFCARLSLLLDQVFHRVPNQFDKIQIRCLRLSFHPADSLRRYASCSSSVLWITVLEKATIQPKKSPDAAASLLVCIICP